MENKYLGVRTFSIQTLGSKLLAPVTTAPLFVGFMMHPSCRVSGVICLGSVVTLLNVHGQSNNFHSHQYIQSALGAPANAPK